MLRLAAHLPDAAVGFAPVLDRFLDLLLEHRPQLVGDVLPGLAVQVHRVEHGAPDVVLALVVGAVADAHRTRSVVAGEVVQFVLDEFSLAADGVHHLQRLALAVVGTGDVGDEREEVVGLAVQSQRVQTPQREGGVAHPGVSVVPVAFAPRCFRQGRRTRGQQSAGGRVGESLQRQRTALQIRPPRVVREVADVDPLPPRLGGLPHLLGGLIVGLRRGVVGPRQRDEGVVALLEPGAGTRLAALDADPEVGGQPQRGMVLPIGARSGGRLAVGVGGVLPGGVDAAVVETRFAVHHQLHRAADTPDGAQQDVLGVPVHRRAAVRA